MPIDQTPGQPESAPGVNPVTGPTRRAWLTRSALVATPVVASLASAPVHAATGVCVLPSGFISATTFLSRHPGAVVCTSNGPTYWLNNPGAWPASTPTTTVFSVAFPGALEGSMVAGTTTLLNVLAGPFSNFVKYIIAALLNARNATSGFPLTDTQVIAVWNRFRNGGSPGLVPPSWTEGDAVAWLATLMNP